MKNIKSFLTAMLICSLSLQLFFYSETYADVKDKIGGSGSSEVQAESSGDNFLIYVAAAAVVGLIAWKVISDRNKKSEIEDADSTQALILKPLQNSNGLAGEVNNLKEKLPVDLFLGVNSSTPLINDRRINFGVKLKF